MKQLILFGIVTVLLTSCGADAIFKKADHDYEYLRYDDAIVKYEKGIKKERRLDALERLANSYFYTNKLDKAQPVYEEVIERNSASYAQLNYGKLLMSKGEYDKAISAFEFHIKNHGADVVASMLIASCKSIQERYRDTTLFEMHLIQTDEFTAAFSPIDYQNGVVFSAEKEVFSKKNENPWTGNSYLNLYYMEKGEDGSWMAPEMLAGDINGQFHEGPATFSADGKTVYFTRSNYRKKNKLADNAYDESNLKIFKAELVDDKWTNLEELPFNSEDYSCGHPSLSADGQHMYFVSDMPGGQGGTDIYRVKFKNGQWGQPENLGAIVNTTGNEMFPYIHQDGTLYFSSNAHNSMGGLDVFMTYFYKDRWMKPENLNYPMNTTKDDFGFVLSSDNITGFVSSARTDKDEIYNFKKNPPTFNLFGLAHKKGSDEPIEGIVVEITRLSDGEIIKMTSDKDGKFRYKLSTEEEYGLLCTKIGCFSKTDKISTKGLKYSHNFYADFEVEEIVINKPIVLKDIFYDFDKWNIREDAAKELDRLAKLLVDNPNIHIQMGSHTDARGTDNYNLILSDKRAEAAVAYLIMRGIDPKRLSWKGYGETEPLNECVNGVECDEEKHQENRRTEFRVTKK